MNIHSPKFKSKIKRVLFLVAGWIAASVYINIMHHSAMLSTIEMYNLGDAALDHTLIEMILHTSMEVLIAGTFLAVIEVFYFTDRFRRKSFTFAVLMKTAFYAFGLLLFTFIFTFFNSGFNLEIMADTSLRVFFMWGPIFLVSTILLQMSDKYGQGILPKFILGKYHTQKEEIRIFMFLDIKSSTSIAEALGNVKYFGLLKDFFYDITDAIMENNGEIYQYVGDEIVISWKLKEGIENSNAVNCFFDIQNAVRNNSGKYLRKYNLIPTFKAGIHYGEVTVGEVGVLKREITFSGDVLNTTARIQELCNKYNERFIASKNFIVLKNPGKDFILNEIGELNLRGRKEPITLFSIRKN